MADDKFPVSIQADDMAGAADDNYKEHGHLIQSRKPDPRSKCCSMATLSTNVKSVILFAFTLLGHLVMSLLLPIWSSTFKEIGSDIFSGQLVQSFWELVALFLVFLLSRCFDKSIPLWTTTSMKYLLVYGMSSALTGTFIAFASLPQRTPPYLQAILGSSLIPFTVICRYIMLRKGVSLRRGVCIVIAMIGLFITMEPRIWGLTGSSGTGSGSTGTVTPVARILWPLCFCFGFVPDAVNRVVTEQELKRPQANTLNFLAYSQLATIVCVILLFWTDLIPEFGMADSLGNFWNQLTVGMRCSVSWDTSCHHLAAKVWLMVLAHVVGYFFHFLLIRHAEGAILASIVQAMRTPIASIFWTLYHYNEAGDYLYWSPEFNITTCFLIGGLFIVVPAVLVYNYFSNEEMEKVFKKEQILIIPEPGSVRQINS